MSIIHGEPQLCHETNRTRGVDGYMREPCRPGSKESNLSYFLNFAGAPGILVYGPGLLVGRSPSFTCCWREAVL